MKLKPIQRRDIIRSINLALAEEKETLYGGVDQAKLLLRVSRMIANLNGRKWPA